MGSQQPAPTGSASEVVDLTAGMDDVDLSEDSDGVKAAQASATGEKKAKRKGKRGGRRKSGKDKKRQMDAQNSQDLSHAPSPFSDTATVATVLLHESEEQQDFPRQKKTNNKGKHIWVPILPHYALCPINSSSENTASGTEIQGIEEYGVFATQELEQGTRIISEPALIALTAPGDQLGDLMEAYEQLPEHEQDRIWSLSPSSASASPLLTALANVIDPMIPRITEILAKNKGERTEEEQAELDRDALPLVKATITFRIAARWHASRYSLINLPENQRSQLPEGTPITGLFVETAHLRHSCVPNCYANYNAATDRMTVHTIKAIAAGEELTVSSFPTVYYETASERAQKLKNQFDITCNCEACDPSHHKFKMHEETRIRAHMRAIQLEHFLTRLELSDTNDLLNQFHLTEEYRPTEKLELKDFKEAEQLVLDICRDIRATGYDTGVELIRWFNALIDRIQPRLAELLPEKEMATRLGCSYTHAIACTRLAKWCLGEDSQEVKQLERREERAKAVHERMQMRVKALKESKKKIV